MAGRPVAAGRPFFCRGLASVGQVASSRRSLKRKNVVRNCSVLLPNSAPLVQNCSRLVPKDARRVPNCSVLLPNDARLLPNDIDLLPNSAHLVPNSSRLAPNEARLLPSFIDLVPSCSVLPPNSAHFVLNCSRGARNCSGLAENSSQTLAKRTLAEPAALGQFLLRTERQMNYLNHEATSYARPAICNSISFLLSTRRSA